jgi:hypothetical protein
MKLTFSQVLFDVPFGAETTWEPIFRSLFNSKAVLMITA